MKKEFRAIAYGRVQWVRYRQFAAREAGKLGLTGTVAIGPHATVQVVAVGEEEKLQQFIEKLRRGPLLADVRELEVIWDDEPRGDFEGFSILWT